MGKYEQNRVKKSHKWLFAVCLLLLVGFLALFIMPQVLYKMNAEPESGDIVQDADLQDWDEEMLISEEDGNSGNEPANTLEFPVILDEGNIEIESLFPFSGVNPDAGNQKASDVASIVLKNASGRYLSEATVKATLDSGTELTFILRDVPAESTVMAFAVDNYSLLETDVCIDITSEVFFEGVLNNESVEVTHEGMTVTLTNTSSEDLNEIDVYYRDVFHESYFGGMAYLYSIEQLSAGESKTFTAENSVLGVIEVVRVAANNEN